MGELVFNGSLLLALPIALLAGLVSFAAPCVLPLVPGYLGYIGGLDTGERAGRSRLLLGVALFILGFSVVFVLFSVLFGTAGLLLRPWLDLITRFAGVILIVMGLAFIGRVSFLQRTIKPRWTAATGLAGAPVLGIVFGLGWTPCLGPVLTAIYSISFDLGDPWRAAILGVAYCLGLGIPFLLVALGLGWVTASVGWLRRNVRVINIVGGVLLMLIGVLMVSGLWRMLMAEFQAVINAFQPAL